MSLDVSKEASPELTSVDELIPLFRRAEKPRERFRVGMEHEKIGVIAGTASPIPFDGPRGIEELLRRFSRFGYVPYEEQGRVIAAQQPGRTISLEPGGQLELSGLPFASVHDSRRELHEHVARARALGRELGQRFVALGFRPFGTPETVPWMPKARYDVMRAYLPTRGAHALQMMAMTATVQANYDYSSEEDMAAKVRMAMSVSSLVTAAFANSFLVDGKDSGHESFRYSVWSDVDPDRCGLLPFVFEEGFGYRRYVEWALSVPMFFLRRDGRYLPAGGIPFRRFLSEGLGGERATLGDFEDHLTTLFPEVRLKTVIEVRGADAGSLGMNAALPALWKGLLYDPAACAAAERLLAGLSFPERVALQGEVARVGLGASCRRGKVLELTRELVGIAAAGLRAHPVPDGDLTDERPLLDPISEVLERGRSPAASWRERWQGELGRDPLRLLAAAEY